MRFIPTAITDYSEKREMIEMGKIIKTLLIGESWMVHTVETKGADQFSIDYYGEGTEYIKSVLSEEGFEFYHMPCHRVSCDFPKSVSELKKYDVIIISDIGSNTFLLPVETFLQSKKTPNKLQMLKEFVLDGGGLCMAGGYLSFMGIEGKGKYNGSVLEEILPVNFQNCDDRQEHPEGLEVKIDPKKHPIFQGLPDTLRGFLGYNRAAVKEGCSVLAQIADDPFLVTGEFGKGRSIAYATDVAPHWSSPEFCESREYKILWQNMVKWLAKEL